MKLPKLLLIFLTTIATFGCASNQPPSHFSAKEKQCWTAAKRWMDYQVSRESQRADYSIKTNPVDGMNQGISNIQKSLSNSDIRKYYAYQAEERFRRCAYQ